MRRRDFMAGLGIAAALPAISRAQDTIPIIGFMSTRSPDEAAAHTQAFLNGLGEMGYVEGRNVAIENRWAKGDYSQLPSFAADLLRRPLSLVVAPGDPAAKAAKAAGFPVPIVFVVGGDPVRSGLVASMSRPGMATGVNFYTGELGGKRLDLLCTMFPSAHIIGLLLNPGFGAEAAKQHRESVTAAAQSLGRELVVQDAVTDAEIESSFSAFVEAGVAGLVVQNDPFFDSRRAQILVATICPEYSIYVSFPPLVVS
jgi:putative tryptophan/tyrosine transport system substrate-binding protein